MAVYPFSAPNLVAIPGIGVPTQQSTYLKLPGTYYRQGDILDFSVSGDKGGPVPVPVGSISAVVPTVAPTFTFSSSANAPAQPFYIRYCYTGSNYTTLCSALSPEYLVNVPAGQKLSVTVPAAGAPSGATDFVVLAGNVPCLEVVQTASPTGVTALGSAAALTNGLTYLPVALNQSFTDDAGGTIVGLALDDSDKVYTSGPAGSNFLTNTSLFGADVTGPPIGAYEQYSGYVAALAVGQPFEISCANPWSPALVGTSFGLLQAQNTFAVDNTQSNLILTCLGQAGGPTSGLYGSNPGSTGDVGVRVIAAFNAGAIL